MAKVKLLVEGYLAKDTKGHTCSNVVLVQDGKTNIIVDPGTLPSQELLTQKLRQEGLAVEDINIVFITHSHMDHYRNIGMFPKAKSLDYWGWWIGDVWKTFSGKVSKNISVIKTPGHSYDGITLLINTEKGKIAVCGDVFWKEYYPRIDPYAMDEKKLMGSRDKLLRISDFIVPGHGKTFKVK
ncbi:MAG TPA: MBL fold metallo-hydrolase [Candidatus Nanoarchaeia archaeon]|nr:MBL fold metallo-hydrolase [Candidatus Nanoarchaeia archaeon]